MSVIVTTYRFYPCYLWQAFRWQYLDGRDAKVEATGDDGNWCGTLRLARYLRGI